MLEKGVNHAGFTCDEGDSARYDHVIKSYAKFWHAAMGCGHGRYKVYEACDKEWF